MLFMFAYEGFANTVKSHLILVFILSSTYPHLTYHSTFTQECEEDGSLTNGA